MLIWSRYNLVFRSQPLGLMVYNALSNSLMTVNLEFEDTLEQIKADPETFDFRSMPRVLIKMLGNKVLVQEGEERDLIEAAMTRKLASRFDGSTLALTILVTEDCNFGCPYCYERNKSPINMSEEVQDRLVEFVRGFGPLKGMFVTWFGGEPLMRFDVMQRLSERFGALGIPLSSMIVTNGWLLTDEVVKRLDDLHVERIQVTIEGPPEIHDAKRFHLEHGASFEVIQRNLDHLMLEREWPGRLSIHFNVDETNAEHFAATHDYWMERYPKGRVDFGPSYVDRDRRGRPDLGCNCFDREREIAFHIEQFEKHDGKGLRYYPKRHGIGCIASKRNGFVVGARGQLYKCWNDVGVSEKEIGSIFTAPSKWNQTLIARYMTGVEPFLDSTCKDCFLLPVCEECPMIRYRKKYEGQQISTCARYKGELLPKFLEMHELLKRKQAGNKPVAEEGPVT